MQYIKRLFLLCVPLLAIFCHGGPPLPEEGERPNIIFIMIDALRADRVGYNGHVNDTTPALDSFSKKGVRFKNAYSHSSHTKISIASLFTGLVPTAHGVREAGALHKTGNEFEITSDVLSKEALTMAEVFRNAGYKTCAVITNPHLREMMGFGQGFSKYIYLRHNPPARDVNREVLRVMSSFRDRPFFLYIHYMDVHSPYKPPPRYRDMFAGFLVESSPIHENGPYDEKIQPHQVAYTEAVYDGQVRYFDDRFKKFIKKLKKRGALQNTMVIVTSDHGDEFYEHGGFGHGYTCYEEMLRVPLTMVWPGVLPEGLEVEKTVVQTDLLSTLAFLAGISTDTEKLPGNLISIPGLTPHRGLMSCNSKEREATVYAETYRGKAPRALVEKDKKIIYNSKSDSYEFYDLAKDPEEQNKLGPAEFRRGKKMMKKLRSFMRKRCAFTETSREKMGNETLEEFKSLGYFKE